MGEKEVFVWYRCVSEDESCLTFLVKYKENKEISLVVECCIGCKVIQIFPHYSCVLYCIERHVFATYVIQLVKSE